MPQLILTAVGPDRPGLVGEITGHLQQARPGESPANILDSRMVNLRGRFAVIILLETANPEALKKSLPPALRQMGLALSIVDHLPPSTHTTAGIPFKLKTYSLDQPGLVHRISDVLRSHSVNIEDLRARQESAPFAGDPLFIMEMQLTVPPAIPLKKLRADLESACEKLNATLDLEPA